MVDTLTKSHYHIWSTDCKETNKQTLDQWGHPFLPSDKNSWLAPNGKHGPIVINYRDSVRRTDSKRTHRRTATFLLSCCWIVRSGSYRHSIIVHDGHAPRNPITYVLYRYRCVLFVTPPVNLFFFLCSYFAEIRKDQQCCDNNVYGN